MSGLIFVSTESPIDANDGIGRVYRDIFRSMSAADRARTTLLLVDAAVVAESFALAFPAVRLVQVDTSIDVDMREGSPLQPPASAYSNTRWHWRSAVVYRALAKLCATHAVEYLEFPDRGGLAFCTLQERNLTGLVDGATVAVRLHASHLLRLNAEPQRIAIEDLNLSDLERKCLRDCDNLVTPSLALSDATREAFGFSRGQWVPRVVEHAPFVSGVEGAEAACAMNPSLDRPLVFNAGLQLSAGLETFVRAVSGFVRATPAYTGQAVLAVSPANSEEYGAQFRALVPVDLQGRFEVVQTPDLSCAQSLWKGATIVVSSAFDPLSVLAYEGSLSGARLIVNEVNVAFSGDAVWRDGVNCIKFDGTTGGLANAIQRNFLHAEALSPVGLAVHPAPWSLAAATRRASWRRGADEPLVSVIVTHYNLGGYLIKTIANLLTQDYRNFEILVIDDASTEAQSIQAIADLGAHPDTRIRIVRLSGNVGLASARNVGVRQAVGRYVLTLDSDDLIHPRFLSIGVAALENGPDFSVVVTPAGYFLDGDEVPGCDRPQAFCDYSVFSGEAVLGGMIENRFSTATALFRRTALDDFPYLESLNCYEDWSLYMRMCDSGHRFIVTTDVFFYYRRRSNSMVHSARAVGQRASEYSDLLRTSAPASLRPYSRQLLLGIAAPVAADKVDIAVPLPTQGAHEPVLRPADRGPFADAGGSGEPGALASLKHSHWLERKVPMLVVAGAVAARAFRRAYRYVRG